VYAIGVGAQSTLGRQDIPPPKKKYQMHTFYVIFAKKMNKMPDFYMTIARKIFFTIFRGKGKPPPLPVSYASVVYVVEMSKL